MVSDGPGLGLTHPITWTAATITRTGLASLECGSEGASVVAFVPKELKVKRVRRSFVLSAALAATSLVLGSGAQADPGGNVPDCHGTGSAKNPMVMIGVSANAVPGLLGGGGAQKAPDVLYNVATQSCGGQSSGGNL